MSFVRRALLVLPALAACYAYAPPTWTAAAPGRRYTGRPPLDAKRVASHRLEPSEPSDPSEPEPGASRGEPPATDPPDGVRGRIIEVARSFLGHSFSGDCSGFVRRVLREAEVGLGPLPSARSMSESLHLASRQVPRPQPGDLIFFHDTYDRNRDGKLGDKWTHVALVEAVQGDQVWILHRGGRGIVRLLMDLSRPTDERANDPVRAHALRDPPGTRYLTAELFAGYGAVVE